MRVSSVARAAAYAHPLRRARKAVTGREVLPLARAMDAPTGASPPPRSVKLSNFDIYTTRQKLYVVGLDHLSHRSYVCKIDRCGSFA